MRNAECGVKNREKRTVFGFLSAFRQTARAGRHLHHRRRPEPHRLALGRLPPRNGLAILSALPKCGKTTLPTHLLSALGSGDGYQIVDGREKEDAYVQQREVKEQTRKIALREAPCLPVPFNEE